MSWVNWRQAFGSQFRSSTSEYSDGITGKNFCRPWYHTGPCSGSSYTQVPIEVGYAAFINTNIAIEPPLNFTRSDGQDVTGLNLGLGPVLAQKIVPNRERLTDWLSFIDFDVPEQ